MFLLCFKSTLPPGMHVLLPVRWTCASYKSCLPHELGRTLPPGMPVLLPVRWTCASHFLYFSFSSVFLICIRSHLPPGIPVLLCARALSVCTLRLYLAVFHYMDNFRFCFLGLPPHLVTQQYMNASILPCNVYLCPQTDQPVDCNFSCQPFWNNIDIITKHWYPGSSYASKCCPGHRSLGAHMCSYTVPGLGF